MQSFCLVYHVLSHHLQNEADYAHYIYKIFNQKEKKTLSTKYTGSFCANIIYN